MWAPWLREADELLGLSEVETEVNDGEDVGTALCCHEDVPMLVVAAAGACAKVADSPPPSPPVQARRVLHALWGHRGEIHILARPAARKRRQNLAALGLALAPPHLLPVPSLVKRLAAAGARKKTKE